MAFGLLLSFILTFGHFLSETVCSRFKHHRKRFLNFVAGISLTYLILSLLPEVYSDSYDLKYISFIFLLLGFVGFYIMEHHVYRHTRTKIIARELGILHSGAFFIYHLV